MSCTRVGVIGAGVGGLTSAIHLARRGFHVTIFEKNERPGGRLNQFCVEGHRFDSGPTLLVLPFVYRDEFSRLGASLDDELCLHRVDPTYRLVFHDGRRLEITSDQTRMKEQLEAFEPGSFGAYLRYLEEGDASYRMVMSELVDHQPDLASDLLSSRFLRILQHSPSLLPHYRRMSAYFDDARLKAAFTFQDIYMGLSPFEAPALFSFVPFSEATHGVWFPAGGMYRIVEALVSMARRAGVEFAFNTSIERIDVAGTAARGLLLSDGSRFQADIIVANADLPYVYRALLPDSRRADRLEQKRFSCSVISFFWGLDRVIEAVGPHMLFISNDYRGNFEAIDRLHALPDDPSLYLHAPARIDPSMAPPGQDTLTAIVPVGHIDPDSHQDWAVLRDRARRAVLDRLAAIGVNDLERHIKFEIVYAPPSWRKRYNLVKGATHGLSHTLLQMAYFRPPNRHEQFRNLYFVGASTHPGTGVPTALISGRLTAARVIRDFNKDAPPLRAIT
jgi:phytoene desaturase